jgi:hypothetical protein
VLNNLQEAKKRVDEEWASKCILFKSQLVFT